MLRGARASAVEGTGSRPAPSSRLTARLSRRPLRLLAIAAAALIGTAAPALAQNRTLEMKFSHTGETLKVVYKRGGQYVPSAMREINHFLRDWRRNESTQMDPELIDLLWEAQQHFGGKTIHVVSAYRSPATNAMLRSRSRGVAKTSQHMAGNATDFYIPGVPIAELRAFGVSRQVGGVGYYPSSGSPFVHFDVGSVRAWPRMSRAQLVKIFPDGKTLHLPADGKPLSGYAEAQALEKAGKLAKLNRSGGGSGGGGGGLIAGLFGGGRSDDRERDRGNDRVQVAAVDRSAAASGERRSAAPARTPDTEDRPARVQTASIAPTESADGDGGGGIFRQLPSVSLGGLIDRFRDEDEGDEDAARPEVTPVAPPAAPLTAVASQAPEAAAEETAPPAAAAATIPVPTPAPRPATATPATTTPATAAPDGAPAATPPAEPVLVAALPPARPAAATVASDAATPIAYAPAEAAGDDASPFNATVALVPRPPALPPSTPVAPVETAALTADEPEMEASLAPVLPTDFAPVRGASQRLIADASGVGGSGFATLTAPDRNAAASGGVLLAQGFLGAPSSFSASPPSLNTDRFTGLTITVFARPRS